MSLKVLYANPVFLDYRIPFYKELNRLFGGSFHLVYSRERYGILGRMDLFERIKSEFGDNAHPLLTDYLFDTNSMSFHMKNIEKGHHIPFTFGLMRKIRSIKPNVVITEGFFQWTPLVILYSLIFRIPVFIGYERTPHTERNTSWLKTFHRKLTDKFVKGFLVNGSETKKYLISIGINPAKIHIGGMSADGKGLMSGIDSMEDSELQNLRRELNLPKKGVGISYIFVGKLTERKGVTLLLPQWKEHIKRHPQDKLLLAGNGDLLAELSDAYSDCPSIEFLGPINYGQIYRYYAVSDVFILPTLEDNWSLVVPEAMACGKPVATSIYNGCHPELVKKDVNGIVFDPLNPESLLDALEYFHHVDLEVFGKASIEIEKEFGTEPCAKRVFDAITANIR